MKIRKHFSALALSSSFLITIGCAHQTPQEPSPQEAKKESTLKTSQANVQPGGGEYVIIRFSKGIGTLTTTDKSKLRKLASEAPHRGKIAKFEVLAWADREYPTEGQKATNTETRLAEDRASTIKVYLKKDLNTTENVDAHNMAKRPGMFSEVFRSTDYKLKNTFETTGAAPGDHDNAVEKLESKASRAVVLVKFE